MPMEESLIRLFENFRSVDWWTDAAVHNNKEERQINSTLYVNVPKAPTISL